MNKNFRNSMKYKINERKTTERIHDSGKSTWYPRSIHESNLGRVMGVPHWWQQSESRKETKRNQNLIKFKQYVFLQLNILYE